ncbi:unnamed protein product [Rotaria sp. Silwood1]|nr:unnamed protein product [Rotaria sp. Silwood1]
MYLFLLDVPNLPFINENELLLSSSLKSFDLQIVMAQGNIHSIGLILRCMPKLDQFVFTFIVDPNISPFIMDLTDEPNWREIMISVEQIDMWIRHYHDSITRRENDVPSITMSDTFYMQSTNIFNLNDHQLNFLSLSNGFLYTSRGGTIVHIILIERHDTTKMKNNDITRLRVIEYVLS